MPGFRKCSRQLAAQHGLLLLGADWQQNPSHMTHLAEARQLLSSAVKHQAGVVQIARMLLWHRPSDKGDPMLLGSFCHGCRRL